MSQQAYKVVSLFSGCGGLDLGLRNAGFDIVWANDIDKNAVNIYRHNLGHIVEGDIRSIPVEQIPDCDVLAAGFPCQPFSSAGNRLGVEDQRGTLYAECIRVIKSKKPKVVLFENVRGILSTKNRDGSLVISSIIHMLEAVEPGYTVKYQLLNASHYGVPQQRNRVILVAFRNDLGINYDFPRVTHFKSDECLKVKHIINVETNVPNQQEVWALSPQSRLLIPYIPEGGSWKDIPYDQLPNRLKKIKDNMKKYGAPNFYRRFGREEINGTITASATPEKCGIIHPLEDRRYSVREVARIQSFPDDYVFVGSSVLGKYKAIGNAVPPLLGEVMGKSILNHLQEHDNAVNDANDTKKENV